MTEKRPVIDQLSVVIPVSERGDNLNDVFSGYHHILTELDIPIEFIIVMAPQFGHLASSLEAFDSKDAPVMVVVLNRNYGEAGEISIGVGHAQYEYVLTLPPYQQIEYANLPEALEAMNDNDVLIVNRWPRIDPVSNKLQSFVFKGIFKMLAYHSPKDPGSGIRLVRKEVFDEVKLYGDMHRFFQILADNLGFKTSSIDFPQAQSDAYRRVYGFKTYLTRFLDIITIVFLTRFNKKPLRFFGAGGALSAFVGIIGLTYIAIERLFFDVAAGDRPLLVLFSLFLVLGIQLIAIGLVGETIIFTSSKSNKEYRIKRIID